MPGDVLLCSVKGTTSGTVAAISYHLVKLMIIHCYSPGPICLLHRPERQVEWGCGGNQHPFILDILDGSTDLCDASRNAVLLLVYYLPT